MFVMPEQTRSLVLMFEVECDVPVFVLSNTNHLLALASYLSYRRERSSQSSHPTLCRKPNHRIPKMSWLLKNKTKNKTQLQDMMFVKQSLLIGRVSTHGQAVRTGKEIRQESGKTCERGKRGMDIKHQYQNTGKSLDCLAQRRQRSTGKVSEWTQVGSLRAGQTITVVGKHTKAGSEVT